MHGVKFQLSCTTISVMNVGL